MVKFKEDLETVVPSTPSLSISNGNKLKENLQLVQKTKFSNGTKFNEDIKPKSSNGTSHAVMDAPTSSKESKPYAKKGKPKAQQYQMLYPVQYHDVSCVYYKNQMQYPCFYHYPAQYQYYVHHHNCPYSTHECQTSCNGGEAANFNMGTDLEPQKSMEYNGYEFEPMDFNSGIFTVNMGGQKQTNGEYVVYLHVYPGVTINLQVGETMEILKGPITVPMVSTNSSPPLAMPVQVPPGHVVQQIVDENGTLRHVILSTSHHQPNLLTVQSHGHGNPQYGTNTTPSQPYYNTGIPPGSYPHQHQHHQPHQYHSNMHPGGPHPLHSPTHVGHSPPPPNPAYHKADERTQRQHIKLKKKLQEKHQNSPQHRKDFVSGFQKRGPSLANTEIKEKGMNSVGTSEDGEESSSVPEEEDSMQIVTDILSSVNSPQVSELSSRSALLQWAPPLKLSDESASNDSGSHEVDIAEEALRYEVLLSDKSREMKFRSIYNGVSLSCRIQDLKPGQEYAVCLQVHLDELQGSATEPIKFVTPPCEPDQPQPPKLTAKTKNSLQLRWNQVNDNGSKIVAYVLEYDAGKGGDFEEVHRGRSRTQFNLTKLQPATAYKFRLYVVNEVGKSAYSESVIYRTTENPPGQPSPPTLVEATVSMLHVKWDRRPREEEYTLQMNDLSKEYGHMNVYNGRDTSYICQRLKCYSNYSFRLKASNEGGFSQWSEEVTYRTAPDRPNRPTKPVVKGRIHAYNFKLKWDPPSDTGGAEITKYVLEVNSGSGYQPVYSGLETEAVCDRLTPGTTYQLRVSCFTSGGQSNPSDPCTVTTDAIAPGQCGAPKLLGKPKPDSLTIRWSEPDYNGGAPVLDYEVEMTHLDSSQKQIVHKSKDLECTISSDILPGLDYAFQVRAVNRIGPGLWSDALRVTSGAAAPNPPESPILNCRSPFHITVDWKEPRNNGAAVTEYRLEMSTDSTNNDHHFVIVYQGPQRTFEAKSLLPFTTYFFRVQAANSAGFSHYSPISATITPAAPPSPVVISHSEATPTTITLYWTQPNCNGCDITHYNIEVGDKILRAEAGATKRVLEGLQPDTHYKIKIQAVNNVAPGPYSSTWRTSTLRLPPAAPTLECIGVSHNSLKLKWGDGKNLDYTQYCVEMISHRSSEWQCVYKGTALTCKVNKLHELTTYTFRINASNDAGVGEPSRDYHYSTTIAPPAAIKVPKVTEIDQRTCSIEWMPSKNTFSDPVVYSVQLSRSREQDYKQVYKGSDTKYTFEDLEPGTEYFTKVTPIRLTPNQQESEDQPPSELQGSHSPVLNFTTVSDDVSAVTKLSPVNASPTHSAGGRASKLSQRLTYVNIRKFYEDNLVYIYALLLTVVGIIISLGITSLL